MDYCAAPSFVVALQNHQYYTLLTIKSLKYPIWFIHCRYQQDHGCPKYVAPVKTMTATKAVVDKILSNGPGRLELVFSWLRIFLSGASEPKKIRSVKAQKTAAKVQLMKLKMKSSGNKTLPQEERTYFMVRFKFQKGFFKVHTIQFYINDLKFWFCSIFWD